MLSDNQAAALLIRLGDATVAFACHATGEHCGSCGIRLRSIPAMLLYRRPLDLYEPLCRDCTLVVVRAAGIRIEHGDSGG